MGGLTPCVCVMGGVTLDMWPPHAQLTSASQIWATSFNFTLQNWQICNNCWATYVTICELCWCRAYITYDMCVSWWNLYNLRHLALAGKIFCCSCRYFKERHCCQFMNHIVYNMQTTKNHTLNWELNIAQPPEMFYWKPTCPWKIYSKTQKLRGSPIWSEYNVLFRSVLKRDPPGVSNEQLRDESREKLKTNGMSNFIFFLVCLRVSIMIVHSYIWCHKRLVSKQCLKWNQAENKVIWMVRICQEKCEYVDSQWWTVWTVSGGHLFVFSSFLSQASPSPNINSSGGKKWGQSGVYASVLESDVIVRLPTGQPECHGFWEEWFWV